MSRRTRTVPFVLLAVLLGGCAGGRSVRVEPPAPPEAAAVFPAAPSILEGFEIDAEPGPWRIGDRVLLGIRVTRDGKSTTLYMETELVGAPRMTPAFSVATRPRDGEVVSLQSATCRTRIRLYDEHGEPLVVAGGSVPTMILNCGPFEAAEEELRIQEALQRGERRSDQPFDLRAMRGYVAFIAFGQSSGRNRLLSSVVRKLVRRPPILGLLFDRGLYLGWDEGGPTRASQVVLAPGVALEANRLPMHARAGGRDVARAVLLVAPSTAPIGLCGGILRADIQHPSEPGTRAHVRILAARRGTGETVAPLDPIVTREPAGKR